jgi:hypothetical protein
VVGRTLEEEAVIAMGEIVDLALKSQMKYWGWCVSKKISNKIDVDYNIRNYYKMYILSVLLAL